MGSYLRRKIFIYLLTFFFAVTLDWIIPRFMPGDPILALVGRLSSHPQQAEAIFGTLQKSFKLDQPLINQYLNFWISLFKGDLGISITIFPRSVMRIIREALPYDLLLTIPAILLSWIVGNKFGAFAARKKRLDNWVLPFSYVLTATPYLWLGILLAWAFGVVFDIFPIAGAYSFRMSPSFSIQFILDYLYHWILPFLSLFLVQLGGWAIGMRNMIIYELESDYSKYLETMGASDRLIRRYAFKNAILPQVTGLAVQLGVIVTGAITTEIVFSYPGIGYLLNQAIMQEDFFLIQGCFLFVIIGVLLANFIIDIVYIILDPRVRHSMGGEGA